MTVKTNTEQFWGAHDEMLAERSALVDKYLEKKVDRRASTKYVREVPVSQAEKDFYLKKGEKESWYFEPYQQLISWKYDAWVDSYKQHHGRMPPGYAYKAASESASEVVNESAIRYPLEIWD